VAKNKDDDVKPQADAGAEGVTPLDDEPPKKGKLKKLLLILIPLLLIGVGAGLYFTGIIGGKKEPVVAEGAEGEHAAEGEAEPEVDEHGNKIVKGAQFLELPDLLVNLSAASGGAQRFLKLKVKLEVESTKDLEKLEAVVPRVVDQFQTFLREMRVQDLRGSAGIYRLRQELLYRVNLAAQPTKVKDVLFQEILIQ
jgi:flagellar FliL protein